MKFSTISLSFLMVSAWAWAATAQAQEPLPGSSIPGFSVDSLLEEMRNGSPTGAGSLPARARNLTAM